MPYKLLILISLILLIVACSSVNYKPTAYPYEIEQEIISRKPIKNVIISTINYGKPSRHYLSRHEEIIDSSIKGFLEENNFSVRSSRLFDQVWEQNLEKSGDVYNPSTGLVTHKYQENLTNSLNQLFTQQPTLDAVIFTGLIEFPVRYGNASNRTAQWHGVMRKVKMQGVGDDFATNIDWFKSVSGISLDIVIINRQQDVVFHSIGGIQVAQAIEIHNKTGKFVRRQDLLQKQDDIDEAINLAFHPFIFWKDHPGFE